MPSIERRLAALLKLPGNDSCSECDRPDNRPSWGSLFRCPVDGRRLGVLCCPKCHHLHQTVGEGEFELKGLKDIDDLTEEDLDALETSGNKLVNAAYEARVRNEKEGREDRQHGYEAFFFEKMMNLTYFNDAMYAELITLYLKRTTESEGKNHNKRSSSRHSGKDRDHNGRDGYKRSSSDRSMEKRADKRSNNRVRDENKRSSSDRSMGSRDAKKSSSNTISSRDERHRDEKQREDRRSRDDKYHRPSHGNRDDDAQNGTSSHYRSRCSKSCHYRSKSYDDDCKSTRQRSRSSHYRSSKSGHHRRSTGEHCKRESNGDSHDHRDLPPVKTPSRDDVQARTSSRDLPGERPSGRDNLENRKSSSCRKLSPLPVYRKSSSNRELSPRPPPRKCIKSKSSRDLSPAPPRSSSSQELPEYRKSSSSRELSPPPPKKGLKPTAVRDLSPLSPRNSWSGTTTREFSPPPLRKYKRSPSCRALSPPPPPKSSSSSQELPEYRKSKSCRDLSPPPPPRNSSSQDLPETATWDIPGLEEDEEDLRLLLEGRSRGSDLHNSQSSKGGDLRNSQSSRGEDLHDSQSSRGDLRSSQSSSRGEDLRDLQCSSDSRSSSVGNLCNSSDGDLTNAAAESREKLREQRKNGSRKTPMRSRSNEDLQLLRQDTKDKSKGRVIKRAASSRCRDGGQNEVWESSNGLSKGNPRDKLNGVMKRTPSKGKDLDQQMSKRSLLSSARQNSRGKSNVGMKRTPSKGKSSVRLNTRPTHRSASKGYGTLAQESSVRLNARPTHRSASMGFCTPSKDVPGGVLGKLGYGKAEGGPTAADLGQAQDFPGVLGTKKTTAAAPTSKPKPNSDNPAEEAPSSSKRGSDYYKQKLHATDDRRGSVLSLQQRQARRAAAATTCA